MPTARPVHRRVVGRLRRALRPARGEPGLPRREPGDALRRQPGRPILFPSLGYFGGIAANRLVVGVDGPISAVRLFLPPSLEGQLDLRGIEFAKGGRKLDLDGTGVTFAASSDVLARGPGATPLTLGGIRTERELGPWWEVRFSVPVDADELRVYNRRDGYGMRSRKLTIATAGPDGRLRTVASVDSDRVVQRTLDLLTRILGEPVGPADISTEDRAQSSRAHILGELSRRAAQSALALSADEQRLLMALIPTAKSSTPHRLNDDEWALAGLFIAAERKRVPSTGTSMLSLQFLLQDRPSLRRLEREVNVAGAVLGTPQAVLTRHGFVDVGGLRARSDDYIALIQDVTAFLNERGFEPMLAYGTLLGAVREGDFLLHDDDIDMLVPLPGANREEVEVPLAQLRRELAEGGWKITRPNSYTNFHVTDPQSGLHLDVFPLLIDGDVASLHMEKMRLRTIPADVVLPPKFMTFKGHEVPVPANPESFLEERYGETWRTPDVFHDWPWTLADT